MLLRAAAAPSGGLPSPLLPVPAASWLPEQPGPEQRSVGGSAWGRSPALIPAPQT